MEIINNPNNVFGVFMLNIERQTRSRTGANPTALRYWKEWINQNSYKEFFIFFKYVIVFFIFHKVGIESYNL